MELFAALRKIREFERQQLPFIKSVNDFDIVIEIGYAEELGKPLGLKQLFLLDIGSRTTLRRRLARLIERGIVVREKHKDDHRSALLTIAPASAKLFARYGGALMSISAAIGKKI